MLTVASAMLLKSGEYQTTTGGIVSATILPMNPEETPPVFDPLTEAELFALELRWYEGRMLPYVEWLFAFTHRHREEILHRAGPAPTPAALLAAVKAAVAERGSMHPVGEMKDQMREIHNELWYRGEMGDYDHARIELDWTEAHAAAWRRWRIKEYLFVAGRCADQVAARLLATESDPREERR